MTAGDRNVRIEARSGATKTRPKRPAPPSRTGSFESEIVIGSDGRVWFRHLGEELLGIARELAPADRRLERRVSPRRGKR
jgi:hypothetical protein